jgi:hypothetical protein
MVNLPPSPVRTPARKIHSGGDSSGGPKGELFKAAILRQLLYMQAGINFNIFVTSIPRLWYGYSYVRCINCIG